MHDDPPEKSNRRTFLSQFGVVAATPAIGGLGPILRAKAAPAALPSNAERPQVAHGIQIGDVSFDRALVWSRSDRPARLLVEWDLDPRFRRPRAVRGPHALEDSDYTARVDLTGLPPGQDVFLRVRFSGLRNERALSEAVLGRLRTPSWLRRDVRLVWGGDTAGQGFGINPDFGGMRIYETMRQREPDLFIHSGDTIYADGPIPAEKTVEDGKLWRNLVTEEKSKVAETLAEFRGNYKYNLLDANVRAFNAEVPQIWQWDDHEVTNNWSDSKDLSSNAAYTEKNVPLLVARGTRAFLEYAPLRSQGDEERERVYRHISYGPLLDVFVLDMRSYRAANGENREPAQSDATTFLGREQLEWLKRRLASSRATWKIVAADMPIGLIVGDGKNAAGKDVFEAIANGSGPALGRELELAELLQFVKRRRVRNVVWLTADVHYCAAHFYDPGKAQFTDFDPFWEFVAGPLNAGSFGPNQPDDTFGMQVVFQKAPPAANYSPFGGFQFFGQVDIDGWSGNLRVSLVDLDGNTVFEKTLPASGG
ncbi:MAG TPA: alkaline phosphatase D family protein [Polyangiales bacterium]